MAPPNAPNNLPHLIKCRLGNHNAPRTEFSKNQLQRYSQQLRSGNAKTGVVCRRHTQTNDEGIQCEGPCGEWKDRNSFSRNSRASGGRQWCLDCMSWSENQVHGQTPLPAPRGQWSIDDESTLLGRTPQRPVAEQHTDGAYDDEDDDDDDDVSLSTRTSRMTMSAPHHHLPKEESEAGADYMSESAPTDDLASSVASIQSGRQPTKPVANRGPTFMSYGPNGEAALRSVRGSSVTDTASVTSSAATVATGRSGWAKPSGRKVPVATPAYIERQGPASYRDYREADDFESDDEP